MWRDTGQYEVADTFTRFLYAGWLGGMGLIFAYGFLFVPSRYHAFLVPLELMWKSGYSDIHGSRVKTTFDSSSWSPPAVFEGQDDCGTTWHAQSFNAYVYRARYTHFVICFVFLVVMGRKIWGVAAARPVSVCCAESTREEGWVWDWPGGMVQGFRKEIRCIVQIIAMMKLFSPVYLQSVRQVNLHDTSRITELTNMSHLKRFLIRNSVPFCPNITMSYPAWYLITADPSFN